MVCATISSLLDRAFIDSFREIIIDGVFERGIGIFCYAESVEC